MEEDSFKDDENADEEEETEEEDEPEITAEEDEEETSEEADAKKTEESAAAEPEEKKVDSFNREMHNAVCADCGKNCEVPFTPTAGRSVYCRDCYRKHMPQRRRY